MHSADCQTKVGVSKVDESRPTARMTIKDMNGSLFVELFLTRQGNGSDIALISLFRRGVWSLLHTAYSFVIDRHSYLAGQRNCAYSAESNIVMIEIVIYFGGGGTRSFVAKECRGSQQAEYQDPVHRGPLLLARAIFASTTSQ